MHSLGAAQGDAAMIIFQPACAARLCRLTLFFCVFTDLREQGP
jgi:hypothetical protein